MPELNGREVSPKTFVLAKLKTPKVLAVVFLVCACGYALTLLPEVMRLIRTLLPDWVNRITWEDFKLVADILCAILAVFTVISLLAIYARCEILRRWKREKANAHMGRRSLKEQFHASEPCDLYPEFNFLEAVLYVLFARRVPVWDLAQVDAFGEPFKDRVEVMDTPELGREQTPYTFDESHGGGPRGLDSPPRGIMAAVAPLKRAVVRNATTAYGPFARIMSKAAGATQQHDLTRGFSKIFSKAAGVMEQSSNDRNNPEKEASSTNKGELRSGMSIEAAFKLVSSGSYFRLKTINSRMQWLRKSMRAMLGSKGKNYFVVQLHSAKNFLLVYDSELSAAHEAKMFFTLKQLKTASVSFERGELLIHDYFEEAPKENKTLDDIEKDRENDTRKKLLLHDIPGSFLSALTISIQHLASRGMRD